MLSANLPVTVSQVTREIADLLSGNMSPVRDNRTGGGDTPLKVANCVAFGASSVPCGRSHASTIVSKFETTGQTYFLEF